MKRRIMGYVAVMVTVICLCAAPSFAADNFKIGVGYQGLIAGNYLNGLSVRSWFGPNTAIGAEFNVFYGSMKGDLSLASVDVADMDAKLWMAELKAMYAFVVRQNSRFFAGAKFAYGKFDANGNIPSGPVNASVDGTIMIPGVLVGAEWNFPSLPELGFNFEVGYNYVMESTSFSTNVTTVEPELDMKLHGINVAAGIKYYF